MKKIFSLTILLTAALVLGMSIQFSKAFEYNPNDCGKDVICKIEDLLNMEHEIYDVYNIANDLDFTNKQDYNNPLDTSYGDINNDGVISGIYTELTTGYGFKPLTGMNNGEFSKTVIFHGEIKNLYINREEDYVGLFSKLGEDAVIENALITSADVTNTGIFTGILAGINNGSIISAGTTGTVTGTEGGIVAGVVGQNHGSITLSASNANVFGGGHAGGFVGVNFGSISDSYATGKIFGTSYLGGFVGMNHQSGTIDRSYASGDVNASLEDNYYYIAGFAGKTTGLISNSVAMNNVITTGATDIDHMVINQRHISYNTEGERITTSRTYGIQYARFANMDRYHVNEGDNGSPAQATIADYPYLSNNYANSDMTIDDRVYSDFKIYTRMGATITDLLYNNKLNTDNGLEERGPMYNPIKGNTAIEENAADLTTFTDLGNTGLSTVLDSWNLGGIWEYQKDSDRPTNGAIPNDYGRIASGHSIDSIEDLLAVENDLDGTYVLAADLDFLDYDSYENPFVIASQDYNGDGVKSALYSEMNSYLGFNGLGGLKIYDYDCDADNNCKKNYVKQEFTGSLFGNGYKISNLYIAQSSFDEHEFDRSYGLFKYTNGAFIEGLVMEDFKASQPQVFGSVAGTAVNTVFKNVDVTGEFSDPNISTSKTHFAGGIVGHMVDSTVVDSSGFITGSLRGVTEGLGGLVGNSRNSIIKDSFGGGNITSDLGLGGIVGFAHSTRIEGNTADLTVNNGGSAIGGIVGTAGTDTVIFDNYSTVDITGLMIIGGIAGDLIGNSITDSNKSEGFIDAEFGFAGGLAGTMSGYLVQEERTERWYLAPGEYTPGESWAEKEVEYMPVLKNSYTHVNIKGDGDLGSIVGGVYDAHVYRCYGTGSIDSEMAGSYIGGAMGTVGGQSIVEETFYFLNDETEAANINGHKVVGGFVGNVKNEAIIRESAVIQDFDAHLEVFLAVYIGGFVGLNQGTIENSYVENLDITQYGPMSEDIGGFVGFNSVDGIVTSSYTTTDIKASAARYVGGFAGRNYSGINVHNDIQNGRIENSYALNNTEIIGQSRVGGFVGDNSGLVSNVYAINDVKGEMYVGGLVGYNTGSVENSIAYTSSITSDTETVGRIAYNLNGRLSNNYIYENVIVFYNGKASTEIVDDMSLLEKGLEISILTATELQPLLSWDFENTWSFGVGSQRPILKEAGVDYTNLPADIGYYPEANLSRVGGNVIESNFYHTIRDYGALTPNIDFEIDNTGEIGTVVFNAKLTGYTKIGWPVIQHNIDEDAINGFSSNPYSQESSIHLLAVKQSEIDFTDNDVSIKNFEKGELGEMTIVGDELKDSSNNTVGYYSKKTVFEGDVIDLENNGIYTFYVIGKTFGEEFQFKFTYSIDGTESTGDSSSILLRTVEDLYSMRFTPTGNYKLNNDIDFRNEEHYEDPNSTEFGDINGDSVIQGIYDELNTIRGWRPISDDAQFTGTLDGQGYSIKNFYTQDGADSYRSFFGNLDGNFEGGTCDTHSAGGIQTYEKIEDYAANCKDLLEDNNGAIVIQNITFENPYVVGYNFVGVIAGLATDVIIRGVDVVRTTEDTIASMIAGADGIGGYIGRANDTYIDLSNSRGLYIRANAHISMFVGSTDGNLTIRNSQTTHNYISSDQKNTDGNGYAGVTGTSMINLSGSSLDRSNTWNSGSDKAIRTHIHGQGIGGFIGLAQEVDIYGGTFTNIFANDTTMNSAAVSDFVAQSDIAMYVIFGQGSGGAAVAGTIRGNSHVKHVGAKGFIAGSQAIAGLVAKVEDDAIVENVHGEGYVGFGDNAGGLASYTRGNGTIKNSSFIGNVGGQWEAGGLVSRMEGGNVEDSFYIGSVAGDWMIGGMVGAMHEGSITNSYVIADVYGEDCVGGLVGQSYTTSEAAAKLEINNSYYVGSITGVRETGLLVGYGEGGGSVRVVQLNNVGSYVPSLTYNTDYFENPEIMSELGAYNGVLTGTIDFYSKTMVTNLADNTRTEIDPTTGTTLSHVDHTSSNEFTRADLTNTDVLTSFTESGGRAKHSRDDVNLTVEVRANILDLNVSGQAVGFAKGKLSHDATVEFSLAPNAGLSTEIITPNRASQYDYATSINYGGASTKNTSGISTMELLNSFGSYNVDVTILGVTGNHNGITVDDFDHTTADATRFSNSDEGLTPVIAYIDDIYAIEEDFQGTWEFASGDLTFDFANPNHYKDHANSKGIDYNRDGQIEDLSIEFTTGAGFRPLGDELVIQRYQNAHELSSDVLYQSFKGEIIGNNATLINFRSVKEYAGTVSSSPINVAYAGLFARVVSASIDGLNFDNSYANASFVGLVSPIITKGSTVTNITVTNSKVDGYKNIGLVVGEVIGSEVSGINISDSEVHGIQSLGGAVGYASKDGYSWDLDKPGSTIKDVTIDNVTVKAYSGQAGSAVGMAWRNVDLSNIHVTNSFVDGFEQTGGVFGYVTSASTVTDVSFIDGLVQGYFATGGITGKLQGSTLDNTTVIADIIGVEIVGGTVGQSDTSNDGPTVIEFNYVDANIHAKEASAGGIVGKFSNSRYTVGVDAPILKNNYSTGVVSAGIAAGGISSNNYIGIVSYNVTEATVYASIYAGGIVGINAGTITYNVANNPRVLGNSPTTRRIAFSIFSSMALDPVGGDPVSVDSEITVENNYASSSMKVSLPGATDADYGEADYSDDSVLPYDTYTEGVAKLRATHGWGFTDIDDVIEIQSSNVIVEGKVVLLDSNWSNTEDDKYELVSTTTNGVDATARTYYKEVEVAKYFSKYSMRFMNAFNFYTIGGNDVPFNMYSSVANPLEYCIASNEYDSLSDLNICSDNLALADGHVTDTFSLGSDLTNTKVKLDIVEKYRGVYVYEINGKEINAVDGDTSTKLTRDFNGRRFIVEGDYDSGSRTFTVSSNTEEEYFWYSEGSNSNGFNNMELKPDSNVIYYTYLDGSDVKISAPVHYNLSDNFLSDSSSYTLKLSELDWAQSNLNFKGTVYFTGFPDMGNVEYNIVLRDKDTNQFIYRGALSSYETNIIDPYDDDLVYKDAGFEGAINAADLISSVVTKDLDGNTVARDFSLFVEIKTETFAFEKQLNYSKMLDQKIVDGNLFAITSIHNELSLQVRDGSEAINKPLIKHFDGDRFDNTIISVYGNNTTDAELLNGFYAVDLQDGLITEGLTIDRSEVNVNKPGLYNAYITVTDKDGNEAVRRVTINIKDTVTPDALYSDLHIFTSDDMDLFAGINIIDNDSRVDKNNVEIVSELEDYTVPGTYTVKYRVTDYSGNFYEFERDVVVYQNLNKVSQNSSFTFDDLSNDEQGNNTAVIITAITATTVVTGASVFFVRRKR